MFGFLVTIFDFFLYYPLFNLLIILYNYLPGRDFGIAIICLTLIIRLVLYPLSVRAIHSQKKLQKLQPKLQEIQEKYKDNKEQQAQETIELYRKEKINPFSGLLLIIIQFPILIALYRVFWRGLNPAELSLLYHFVFNPGHVNPLFLGLINLSHTHNIAFAVGAAILQFFQTKMLTPSIKNSSKNNSEMSVMLQRQMMYIFPVVTVLILYGLPAALSLYWITSGIFSIIQQYFVLKKAQ